MKRIYLDYAASTPVDPRVLKAMLPYLKGEFGNPGSLHSFGQAAMKAVDEAREKVARHLGAGFREIIFTGSATEANNLALRGALADFRAAFPGRRPKIVVSAIEHESVLETAKSLAKEGAELFLLPVDRKGSVSLEELNNALSPDTAIVSIMYGNNETGVIQPMAKISSLVRGCRGSSRFPLLHSDAAQALAWLDCRPEALGVDLLTLSAQKIYGPKGVGALYIKQNDARNPSAHFPAIMTGGGQEFGLRSATENVPAIAGFGKAVELLDPVRDAIHVLKMRERFLNKVVSGYPGVRVNGSRDGLPHILNLHFPGKKAEDMLIRLDLSGVAVSSGSACRSRGYEPSHVLLAMGLAPKAVAESLRISFGRMTTAEEVDAAARSFRMALGARRKM